MIHLKEKPVLRKAKPNPEAIASADWILRLTRPETGLEYKVFWAWQDAIDYLEL